VEFIALSKKHFIERWRKILRQRIAINYSRRIIRIFRCGIKNEVDIIVRNVTRV
jgi:hypothetical protein